MNFKTVAEAFNHYRTATLEEIERRAAEIKGIIETDVEADITTLNIELTGLAQAKANAQQNAGNGNQRSAFNPITGAGMSFERRASYEATEGDVLNSPEYRSAFFKTLLGHKLTEFEQAAYNRAMGEQRADAFASSSSVAAALPTQTLNEVISKARTMGGLMSVCRGFNIPAKVAVPVGTPTAASWHAEGAAVESVAPSVASVSFDGYEIMKVLSISEKARKMSVAAFESYMTQELNACVMACIADGLVNGSGTNQGTGVLNGVSWTKDTNHFEFNKANGLTYADVVKVVAALKRGYANGACWAMNNAALYNLFYGLVDANKRPIFIADPKNEGIGKILGFPVVVDDYLPAETVLFGNFNYMGYNLPEGITVEASRESSFKKGLIDYRAMAIADCKPIVGEAFIKLTRATA